MCKYEEIEWKMQEERKNGNIRERKGKHVTVAVGDTWKDVVWASEQ